MPKTKKPKLGDCYDVHARLQADSPVGIDYLLCHGTVWHPEVKWHGHCWIEIDGTNFVMDISNKRAVICPKPDYYRIGKVKDVHRYTREEAAKLMLKFGHYGPWHG